MTHSPHGVTRPLGLRRGGFVVALTLFAAGGAVVLAAPARAADLKVAASQPLVELHSTHVARTRPDAHAHRIGFVRARRPLTGVRTVLPALSYTRSRQGGLWVRVRLPGRPNGSLGWISAAHTGRTATEWQLVLVLSTRRVTAYRDGQVAKRFLAVVGKPSTPTPRGRFFIEETLALPNQQSGPFALATSARSNVLQEFEGGPGQIALHGTWGLSGALGTASSHGCVRLSARAITWLATRIGSGIPLRIMR